MLPERLDRINADGSDNEIRLFDAFLNPLEFNNGGPAGVLTADKAAGAIVRGLSKQVGNELDEFVTSSVRNTLVGLPLDLPAINIARGRSEGVPSLNEARRQFFNATRDPTLAPYKSWSEFRFALRHDQSFVNFVAACGNHPTITGATTVADKRAAAQALVNANDPFPSTSGAACRCSHSPTERRSSSIRRTAARTSRSTAAPAATGGARTSVTTRCSATAAPIA